MTAGTRQRLARALEDAYARASMARSTGDGDGYRYARAEVARLRRILAEG